MLSVAHEFAIPVDYKYVVRAVASLTLNNLIANPYGNNGGAQIKTTASSGL